MSKITIITAENVYLLFMGNKHNIKKFADHLNDLGTKYQFIYEKINIPCANLIHKYISSNYSDYQTSYIFTNDSVETSQCYALINSHYSDMYVIYTIENNNKKFVLSYPEFSLGDELDPEKIVKEWLGKNDLNNKVRCKLYDPINITGKNNDILVLGVLI